MNKNIIHFIRYLEDMEIDYVNEVDPKILEKFILFLKKKKLKPTTINTYLRAVRLFLYYAMREEYLQSFHKS